MPVECSGQNTMVRFANEVGHQIKSGIYLINFIIKSIRERLRLAHSKRIRHELLHRHLRYEHIISIVSTHTHKIMANLCTNKVVVNHFHGTLFLKPPHQQQHRSQYVFTSPDLRNTNLDWLIRKSSSKIFMGTQYWINMSMAFNEMVGMRECDFVSV